jgi:hypothetical protein
MIREWECSGGQSANGSLKGDGEELSFFNQFFGATSGLIFFV